MFIERVITYLPERSLSIASMQDRFNLTNGQLAVFQKLYGLDSVLRSDCREISGFIANLLEACDLSPTERASTKYVLLCQATPLSAPHTSRYLNEVVRDAGLRNSTCITIGQHGCATPIVALELASALLATEEDDARILLLAGDLAFHSVLEYMPETTFVGEAAAACVISKRGERNQILSMAQITGCALNEIIPTRSASQARAARATYTPHLASAISNAISTAGLSISDIQYVFGHNVNTASWIQLAQALQIDVDTLFLENIPKMGHCLTADPFINLATAQSNGRLAMGDLYVLASVGMGGTYAAAIARH